MRPEPTAVGNADLNQVYSRKQRLVFTSIQYLITKCTQNAKLDLLRPDCTRARRDGESMSVESERTSPNQHVAMAKVLH